MSRLPGINFLFVLLLITLLAVRQWASMFGTSVSGYKAISSRPPQTEPFGALSAWSKTVANGFGDFWQRAMMIEEWRLESQADSWELVRPAGRAERNLLEARFHVANAEVFAAAMGDIRRAQAELDRAGGELQNALSLVAGNLQTTLNTIRSDVIRAKSALKTEDTAAESTDEQIKTELDGAIAALHRNRL